mmetsp:Transcript_47409/g.141530  ORF Transcript_47409/g.141530 Transcript_47409/m.141530 type:complete len:239 (-) Transcript_47409:17-733(-)
MKSGNRSSKVELARSGPLSLASSGEARARGWPSGPSAACDGCEPGLQGPLLASGGSSSGSLLTREAVADVPPAASARVADVPPAVSVLVADGPSAALTGRLLLPLRRRKAIASLRASALTSSKLLPVAETTVLTGNDLVHRPNLPFKEALHLPPFLSHVTPLTPLTVVGLLVVPCRPGTCFWFASLTRSLPATGSAPPSACLSPVHGRLARGHWASMRDAPPGNTMATGGGACAAAAG